MPGAMAADERRPADLEKAELGNLSSSSETDVAQTLHPNRAGAPNTDIITEKTTDGPAAAATGLPQPDGAKPTAQADGSVAAAPAKDDGPPPPEATRTSLETTLIVLALASGLFLAALDVSIVTVAIPRIAEDFNSTAGYTWIGSAYLLANAAAAPIWGKISDIWGRKPILLCAVAVFWIGSLLSALAVNMAMLIASRAIQGVGGGGIVILVNISISDLFSMRKRGVYFGVMGMVWALAGGVGPILGGVFTDKVTWRWCFYINLPISGAGFAVLLFVLKLHNPRTPIRQGLAAIDWLGAITIVGGTIMFLLGLELGGVIFPWNSATVICLIVFGVLVVGIFTVIETRIAKYPIIPMRLFQVRSNVASLGVCACHGIVFISASYYLPLYYQAVLGASPLLSGVYVLPFTVSLALTSTVTGIVVRKTGKYLPQLIAGMAVMTLGFGLFIDLGSEANWAKIVIFQLVAGIGVGPNFQSPLISLQTMVAPRDIASATATFGFVRQLATSISVVIGGVVFQNGMQKQHDSLVASLGPDTADLLSGANAAASTSLIAAIPGEPGRIARDAYWNALRTMYIMYVAFAGVGFVISLFVGSRKLSREHQEHKTGLDQMKQGDAEKLKAQQDHALTAEDKEVLARDPA